MSSLVRGVSRDSVGKVGVEFVEEGRGLVLLSGRALADESGTEALDGGGKLVGVTLGDTSDADQLELGLESGEAVGGGLGGPLSAG